MASSDPSRPATGYPFVPNGINYPPPPPGTAYPYQAPPPQPANPYYYNTNQPYPNQRATLLRRLIAALIIVTVIFFTILFIIWLVIRPHLPEFRVTSLSVSSFNVSSSSSSVTGNWNARFQVYNPNKLKISYDDIQSSISYKSEFLSQTRIPPFKQGKRNVTDINAEYGAMGSYIAGRAVNQINGDKGRGSVSFNLKIVVDAVYRVGGFRARRRLLRAFCDDLAVGFSGNGGSGNLTGGARQWYTEVKILEVCQVTPSLNSLDPPTELSFPLSFFDILFLKVAPAERLFFYKLTEATPDYFNSVILPKLKLSLSHTLPRFLPVAGNLIWPAQSTKPIILYTPNDGVSLTIAQSNADFDHLSGTDVCEITGSHPYVPQLPIITDSKVSVLALQITLFPNQGVSIGATVHHGVLDAKNIEKLHVDTETRPMHLSSFVLAYAYVFVRVFKAKGLERDDKVVLGLTADCRARLGIPENYFGCCVMPFFVHIDPETIVQENGFLNVIERLSEIIVRLNKGVLDGAKEKFAEFMTIRPGTLMVTVSGSPQFQIYKADFGWGVPRKVETPSIDKTGSISMQENADGRGGIEIGLVLLKHEMEIFNSLFVDGLV
ncbi:hypothetical protein D5086_017617 [Populus alba]|uniref:Uncharacterized protein n=1 Tax=Populus alba TaxID=43335 RepID=A0ACC4BN19_POPAL